MKLVLVCIECGIVAHAPFGDERLLASVVYRDVGWLLSVVDPPVVGKPESGVLAPLCGACAKRIYPPEVLAEAIKQLEKP